MTETPSEPNPIQVVSYYVRVRNAMAIYGQFQPLWDEASLHQFQIGVNIDASQRLLLQEAIAALTLHLVARPRQEATAWTVNLREPPLNLFVTGDSVAGTVVGRVFTEGVKVGKESLLISQVTDPRAPARQSTIEIQGRDMLKIVEQYYEQSEQLPARLFRLGDDSYTMVVAHPDIDMPWFKSLTTSAVAQLEEQEELRLLERRPYQFQCGCNLKIVLGVVLKTLGEDPKVLFQGKQDLEINCPRCAGTFRITPETVVNYIAERDA